jgi:hypothetical protein
VARERNPLSESPHFDKGDSINTLENAMPPLNRIRLTDFAAICDLPRETFRSMLAQGRVPFRAAEDGDGQRTYGVADLLAMMMLLAITREGRRQDSAARDIIRSGAVAEFFERMEAGRSIDDLLLYIPETPLGDDFHETHFPFVAPAAALSPFVVHELGLSEQGFAPFGEKRKPLGLRGLYVLPIAPVFSNLVKTARALGFAIDGRQIRRIDDAGVVEARK